MAIENSVSNYLFLTTVVDSINVSDCRLSGTCIVCERLCQPKYLLPDNQQLFGLVIRRKIIGMTEKLNVGCPPSEASFLIFEKAA